MTEPQTSTTSEWRGPSGRVAGGAAWTIAGKVAPMAITLFLTPYVLHGLGIVRYGLFILTSTIVGFLATIDGGIKGTAQRYFGVYAGAGDSATLTRTLLTLLLVISVFGVFVSGAGWALAPLIVSLLKMPTRYRDQTVFLFRALGVLLTFSFVHNLFVAILSAFNRFAVIVKMGFVMNLMWAGGLVATVHYRWGLWGVTGVFLAQQLMLIMTIMPFSLRHVRLSEAGLLSRGELKSFLSFGLRVQISNMSSLINLEFDTVTIGVGLSVRSTSIYNAGSNYAQNIASIAAAALPPVQTALANVYGRDGREAAYAQYRRFQHLWVGILTGLFACAAAAAWFGIVAWLGHDFSTGGFAAVIVLVGLGAVLTNSMLTVYCTVIGEPGLQSRYGVMSVLVNIALTVPLVLVGSLGVAAATTMGQLAGVLYLNRLVRRRLHPDLPNPLRSVPVGAAALSAGIVVALEVAIRPIVPQGGLGLVACAVPGILGLAVYVIAWRGARATWHDARAVARRIRAEGIRGGISSMVVSEK
ncbi:oligosaccharide flippase family protein [Acidimicrobiaceae bacterium USS-CC1]|uniref:Oligosaccharide flippase family protein n=1 Tax=Acidiferrimicrobium australe TaxID=2664430 RepID=A0ABW9QQA6_9ACTN|nr:oligosaccharide flippase family protein [Acidiferrimicrobium australe]